MPTKLEIPKELILAEAANRAVKERNTDAQETENNDFKKKQATVAALGAALGSAKPVEGESDLHREVLMELLASLRDDSADRSKKKEAEADQRNRLMLAQAKNVKLERERLQAAQNYCNHMKEGNRGPRIGGQRLSNGHIQYLCTYCHKEWDETTLPAHLQISFEHIGG